MLRNYLAAALRNLARNRFYAAINISGLAVGFCAALLIVLYVRSEYSYDRFFPGYRDVYLLTSIRDTIAPGMWLDPQDATLPDAAARVIAKFPQMQAVARVMPAGNPPHIRRGQVEADETGFVWTDPSFFQVMPLRTLAGDLQTALAAPDSVVLTRTAARKYFGRDLPLGEALEVNPAQGPEASRVSPAFGAPHPMRVTAVIEDLPSNSYLKGDVFGSSRAAYSQFALYDLTVEQGPFRPSGLGNYTFVRLRPGAPVQQLRETLSTLSRDSPVYPPGFRLGLRLSFLADLHLSPAPDGAVMTPRGDKTLLAALMGIAVLIIASASFNFVTLMTARASQRAMETGVRKALGAFRSQLMTQFLGEAVIYVALAMALALALTEVFLPYLNAALKQKIAFNYAGDPTLAGALLAATVALGLLAGAYPAFVLSAYRSAAVLKGTVTKGERGAMVRRALVTLQFAIMIGLGITAITIWRQTLFSLNNQLRVDGSSILLVDFACVPSSQAFRDRLATVPGITQSACANEAALFNGGMIISAQVQGGSPVTMVSGSFDFGALEFYGLAPLAGRFFDRDHGDDGRLVNAAGEVAGNPSIILNETALHALGFKSASQAIGTTVTWNRRRFSPKPNPGITGPSEVIGVMPDLALDTRRPTNPQILYVDPAAFTVLSVRLAGSQIPEALAAIDAAWRETTHTDIRRRFLSERLQTMYEDVTLQGKAISLGAGLAVVIAALGLFGMAASTAERRTKEIGIRKSMGASTGDITRLLMWEFTKPVLWANLIAWPVAWYLLSRWLNGFAYHVNMPLLLFAASSALAVVIALLTVGVHCWRVARAKPMTALRYE